MNRGLRTTSAFPSTGPMMRAVRLVAPQVYNLCMHSLQLSSVLPHGLTLAASSTRGGEEGTGL